MRKVFKNFSEIEDEVRAKVPKTIYKYRGWKTNFHKDILLNNTIWFAHPKSLNDPNDIRAPYQFDYEELNNPLFAVTLRQYAKINFKDAPLDSKELDELCENQLEIIKKDPK